MTSSKAVLGVFLLRVFNEAPAAPQPDGPSPGPAAVFLAGSVDMSSLAVIFRAKSTEVLIFLARSVAKVLAPGKSVYGRWGDDNDVDTSNIEYRLHAKSVQTSGTQLTAVAITHQDYSPRVALSCLEKLLYGTPARMPAKWTTVTKDQTTKKGTGGLISLDETLQQMCHPEKLDTLTAVRESLQETRELTCNNLQRMIARNDTLEAMVQQSEDLSNAAKMFVTQTKKLERCRCVVM